MSAIDETLRVIVRDEIARAMAALREELRADLAQIRDAAKPKMLRRSDVAAMFGMEPDALRQHFYRKSELGKKLIEIAHNFGGEQCWLPSEIAAHCTKWSKRDAEGGE